MVALGCVPAHLPPEQLRTGVATQNDKLRRTTSSACRKMVMNYFTFIADEIPRVDGKLGVRSMEELIGRLDLLRHRRRAVTGKQQGLNLNAAAHPAISRPTNRSSA